MKFPPWLAGLLMVLVLAAVWWTLSWDVTEEDTDPATSPTPTAVSPADSPPRPAMATPVPSRSPTVPAPSSPVPQDPGPDEQDWPEPAGVDTRPWDDIDACDDKVLPATMIPVVEDIWASGPYDYPDRDGTRFGNYEGYLPDEELGYYREFTVETPGLDHRGARRIVTGGAQESDPDVWYYTQDHYESFCEFAP